MNPTETVAEYYEALRRGEPLDSYFAEREDVVKFGVGERLAGSSAVAEGLREQTRTTEDWRVESHRLQVVARESVAWFTDDVTLSWTESVGTRQSFETRWSGVLETAGGDTDDSNDADESDVDEDDGDDWRFAQMHVSAPHDL